MVSAFAGSSLATFLSPLTASLNSLIPLPMALPISGNFLGPKITRSIIKIRKNSCVQKLKMTNTSYVNSINFYAQNHLHTILLVHELIPHLVNNGLLDPPKNILHIPYVGEARELRPPLSKHLPP